MRQDNETGLFILLPVLRGAVFKASILYEQRGKPPVVIPEIMYVQALLYRDEVSNRGALVLQYPLFMRTPRWLLSRYIRHLAIIVAGYSGRSI